MESGPEHVSAPSPAGRWLLAGQQRVLGMAEAFFRLPSNLAPITRSNGLAQHFVGNVFVPCVVGFAFLKGDGDFLQQLGERGDQASQDLVMGRFGNEQMEFSGQSCNGLIVACFRSLS